MRDEVEEQWGKDRKETDQIVKRAIEAKGKVNNAKGTNRTVRPLLKDSWVHTANTGEYEALEELEGHTFEGSPNDRLL